MYMYKLNENISSTATVTRTLAKSRPISNRRVKLW